MSTYTQAYRPLQVATPLGKDALLLVEFSGVEAISELFTFHLELLAKNDRKVSFEDLLGKSATVSLRLPKSKQRHFTGLIKSVSQGERDENFTAYSMDIVPPLWLLTRRVQSRIFQQISVPNILKQVLSGLDVDIQVQGTFHKRDYCVQYGESDFDFASRLMEEEGIYYYFTHGNGSHKLVLANTPQSHADVPHETQATYDNMQGGNRPDDRVYVWRKKQELRSGKVSLRDHCFELTGQPLNAESTTPDSIRVGQVSHKLKVGATASLELYNYPGQYAQRFDGVDPSGGDRAADLQKIFEDNQRTAKIRMQEEAAHSLAVEGQSSCGQLTAGHRFQLTGHFDGNGQYVLVRVRHQARNGGDYQADGREDFEYENSLTCIPFELAYRPPRKTPRPCIHGTQTAVVVGLKGEEIFTDKYGRVKVQFPWDREGKFDAGSSCWVRVASNSAGKKWGNLIVPRIGHEVVVAFEEGDPDRPIVVGNVYNDQNPPPIPLPSKKMVSGMRSATYPGSGGFNEMTMDDTKGNESIFIHAEKDETIVINHDRMTSIGNDSTEIVANNRTRTVNNDETVSVTNNRVETIGVNETLTTGSNRTRTVGQNETVTVGMLRTHSVGINDMLNVGVAQEVTIGAAQIISVGAARALTVGGAMNTAVGGAAFEQVGLTKKISVGDSIEIVCGASKFTMSKDGTVTIEGKEFMFKASGSVKINGSVIDLN